MVKGIDNQVMIHRTAEYARQMAARNDAAENEKQFAAQLEQQRALHDGKTVMKAKQAEQKSVSREGGGHSQKDEENREQKETGEPEQQPAPPPDVLGTEIDITI
jgi:hypothetical protein